MTLEFTTGKLPKHERRSVVWPRSTEAPKPRSPTPAARVIALAAQRRDNLQTVPRAGTGAVRFRNPRTVGRMTRTFPIPIRRTIGAVAVLAAVLTVSVTAQAQQRSAPGTPPDAVAEQKASLEQQLAEQQARNEALRQRIAKLEEVLATDVCTNPEAAAVLQQGVGAGAPTSR